MTSDGPGPRRPTLRQFAIFDAIVRSGSAGAAARMLGLSQPAVTHALTLLERSLGVLLTVRCQAGSQPTEMGTILHRRVARLRDQVAQGLATLRGEDPDSERIRRLVAALTSTQVAGHLAIARGNSFRAAAQSLGISEPALQRTARELERLLGAALYQRQGRHFVVTPAGEQLADRLQLGAAEIEQAYDEIEAARGLTAGRIALGCLPLMPKAIVATALGRLLERFPTVEIALEEGSYDWMSVALRRGKLDMLLGALRGGAGEEGIENRPFFDDPYVVIGRSGHPCRDQASPEALSRQAWIVPPAGTPRRIELERLFATFPRRPRIVLETASVSMMIATLSESDCLSLSSLWHARTDFAGEEMAVWPLPLMGSTRQVGAAIRSDWLPTEVQRAFLVQLEAASRAA